MVKSIKPWKEIATRALLDCRVFGVESSIAESPVDGSQHEYFRIISDDWVQIVPVTAAEEIVMVWQFRHGSSEMSLEVPAGLVSHGEAPADAARRECLEETGYEAGSVVSLGVLRANPAYFSNRLYAYYSLGVSEVAPIQNTGTEQTEVELVRIDDVVPYLRSGKIDHALAAAVLWRFLNEHR